jgi:hypothetical protein
MPVRSFRGSKVQGPMHPTPATCLLLQRPSMPQCEPRPSIPLFPFTFSFIRTSPPPSSLGGCSYDLEGYLPRTDKMPRPPTARCDTPGETHTSVVWPCFVCPASWKVLLYSHSFSLFHSLSPWALHVSDSMYLSPNACRWLSALESRRQPDST